MQVKVREELLEKLTVHSRINTFNSRGECVQIKDRTWSVGLSSVDLIISQEKARPPYSVSDIRFSVCSRVSRVKRSTNAFSSCWNIRVILWIQAIAFRRTACLWLDNKPGNKKNDGWIKSKVACDLGNLVKLVQALDTSSTTGCKSEKILTYLDWDPSKIHAILNRRQKGELVAQRCFVHHILGSIFLG